MMGVGRFRNIDMDKQALIIDTLCSSSAKKRTCFDAVKMAVLNAWCRIDSRTRDALIRSFLTELIEGYKVCLQAFIQENGGEEVTIRIQDPFHRLLVHGVCEVRFAFIVQFYNLVSVTVSDDTESSKMTRI